MAISIFGHQSDFAKSATLKLNPVKFFERTERHKKRWKYWGWKPQSLTWWIGFIFMIGSILFVVGGITVMFPNPPEQKIALIHFIGSVCFTIGSYVALLETINLNLDVTLKYDDKFSLERVGRMRHSSPPPRRIKLFDWHPHRIEYQSSLIQLIGSFLFNVNCFFAMFSGLKWQTINLIVWLPSTIASVCFCLASYLAVMEVCQSYWDWKLQDIEWWIVVLHLLGSVGFLSGSLFGFWGQGPVLCCQKWGTNFSFLAGSIFFLGGSYLMVPEMLNRAHLAVGRGLKKGDRTSLRYSRSSEWKLK